MILGGIGGVMPLTWQQAELSEAAERDGGGREAAGGERSSKHAVSVCLSTPSVSIGICVTADEAHNFGKRQNSLELVQ